MTQSEVVEHFPALDAPGVAVSAFIRRIPGVDGSLDKAEALGRLDAAHRDIKKQLGVSEWPFLTAQQVHGAGVTVIDRPTSSDQCFDGCDGMVTNQRKALLGIYVADCCAVYLLDPVTPAIGLIHSGKKGTEQEIAAIALDLMRDQFGTRMSDVIVQLSPCIRPPHYEIDFAVDIVRQCRDRGVKQIHDSGKCTGCDLNSYYSYRVEKGKTGRMLAVLALT